MKDDVLHQTVSMIQNKVFKKQKGGRVINMRENLTVKILTGKGGKKVLQG